MINKILRSFKKRWLLVWLLAVSVMLMSFMSAFAEFPSALTTMKRVVASVSDYGTKFSSNALVENGSNTYIPVYMDELSAAAKTTSTYDVVVDIWNFSAKNPMDWYKKPITYNVSFRFVDRKGDVLTADDIRSRTVAVYNGDSLLTTLGSSNLSANGFDAQTLVFDEGHSAAHEYTLKFLGTWDLERDEDICVQMSAVPDTRVDTYNDISPLGGIIGLKKTNGGSASGWTAYLSEHPNSTSTGDPDDYDGFNLVVSGSGKATITITCDISKFGLNKYFRDLSKTVYLFGAQEVSYSEEGNTATLTIKADNSKAANEYRTRYNIQVYKNGIYEPEGWNFFAVKGTDTDAVYNAADIKVEIKSTE